MNTIYYTILLVSRSSVGVLRFKVVFDSLFSSCCSMTLYTAPNIASIRQLITTLSHKFKVHASKSVFVWNVHVWYADLLMKTLFYLIKLCPLCLWAFKAFLGLHERPSILSLIHFYKRFYSLMRIIIWLKYIVKSYIHFIISNSIKSNSCKLSLNLNEFIRQKTY